MRFSISITWSIYRSH